MPDLSVMLQLLTLTLLGVGGYLLVLLKTGAEAVVKTSAEEGAKAAIRELEWTKVLARELQKSRGLERQELRFRAYGGLWKELRPLAIYDPTDIDNRTAAELLTKLTAWYFSECGGLLLTPQSRDFYFALQDLLRVIAKIPDWRADRSEAMADGGSSVLGGIFETRGATEAVPVLKYFSDAHFEDWQDKALELGKDWHKSINRLGAAWTGLTERERFATLQQAGSKLRTSLVNDLESRER